MRYLPLTLLAALFVVCGTSSAATSKGHAPLRFGGLVELGGAPVLGSAPGRQGGELLRFVPRSEFKLGLIMQNRSGSKIVVSAARVIEPAGTLIHQIGTRFHSWHVFNCPPNTSCPAHVLPLTGGPAVPRPYALGHGKYVGVELDFQLGSCGQIPHANPEPLSRLRVTFRQDGTTERRVFSLGASSLHLRMPKPGDCADPRSSLSVDGPQQYESSYYWTIPGSTGDVCQIHNGRLDFVSRKYQTHVSRTSSPRFFERVTFHLKRFHGTGTYDRGTVKLIAGKEIVFRSHRPTIDVTKLTRHELVATVEAGRKPVSGERGTPFRITGTMRCRLRG